MMDEWLLSLFFKECSHNIFGAALWATSRHRMLRWSCSDNAASSCIPALSWCPMVYVQSICVMLFGALHAEMQRYRNPPPPLGCLILELY